MGTLMPKNPLHFSCPFLSPPRSLSSFRSFSTKNSILFRFAFQRRSSNRKIPTFCTIAASADPNSPSYGGWDDPELLDDANLSGTLDKFGSFLVSVGIDDKRHAFLFCLGFLSALAVSRVNLVVLPVSFLVFVAGLLAGVAQGGGVGDSLMEISRDQRNVKLSNERMKILGDFLDELGVKMSDLKNGLERVVDRNRVDTGEIKRYLDVIESVGLSTMPVKRIMQDSTEREFSNGPISHDLEVERKSNPKSSKKRKELSTVGFDIVHFLGGLFREGLIGQKAPKAKDIKREVTERLTSIEPNIQTCVDAIDENKVSNLELNNNLKDTKVDSFPQDSFDSRAKKPQVSLGAIKRNMPEMVGSGKSELNNENSVSSVASTVNGKQSRDDSYGNDMRSYSEDLNNLNRSFHVMSVQGSYHKMVLQHKSHKSEVRRQQNNLHDSAESGFSSRTQEDDIISFSTEAEASLQSDQTVEIRDKAYFPSYDRTNGNVKSEKRTQNIGFREGATKSEDQTILGYQHSRYDAEAGNRSSSSSSSSSTRSADEEFNRNVKEATDLLKQAGVCLKGQGNEETAEIILYKSARLLSTAVAMKPTSLLALGKLGNTFLLHGELKLKMSRELRVLLSRNDSTLIGKGRRVQLGELSNQTLSKEKVASVLVDVCEECEELLVEAGRNYRLVLSIDKNDVRALYNWGLALSFRAQLIADIGPEAAFDADKVYLAAIEKFDAMTSRSNDYAPDALFRWGVALQQRSHLRSRKSKEKITLLRQAKSLFEDVLRVESDNPHVREALFSCISELNFVRQLE